MITDVVVVLAKHAIHETEIVFGVYANQDRAQQSVNDFIKKYPSEYTYRYTNEPVIY